MDFGSLLLPAALVFGAPVSPGTYEKGLFCDSVELVEEVVHSVEKGVSTRQTVAEINGRIDRVACIYILDPTAREQLVRKEKAVEVSGNQYSIYRVRLISLGTMKTEIGDLDWAFSLPITMYTLRSTVSDRTVGN